MLKRIDRIQITARDAEAVAARWTEVVDAVVTGRDSVPALAARRVVIQAGASELEILQPTGEGPVADHLTSGRGGVFAAGVATGDLDALAASLGRNGVEPLRLEGQLFLPGSALGIPGLDMLVSPHVERAPVGLLAEFYEVTHLTADAAHASAAIARLFALDARFFVAIRSETYGYDGALTLFRPDALHRIETIHPYERGKTMARYFDRFGPSLYMCYAETDDLPRVRERLVRVAPQGWTGSVTNDDGLFIHPKTLGGVMVGVSRRSFAWTWSGHPDRVTNVSGVR